MKYPHHRSYPRPRGNSLVNINKKQKIIIIKYNWLLTFDQGGTCGASFD